VLAALDQHGDLGRVDLEVDVDVKVIETSLRIFISLLILHIKYTR
jgi:hypothetical protein